MKYALIGLLMLGAAPSAMAAENPPAIPFDGDVNFIKMPNDMNLGEVSGVAVNSQGHVFVFHRGTTDGPAYGARAAQLLEFDQNGNYVREIGKNLYAWSFAHTVRIDRQDNIWIADKGSDMVVKFTPQGRPVMMLGRKPEASDEGAHPLEHPNPPLPAVDGLFRQVTDMTWDPAGNTYISDGYINSRVAKYDKDGNWLMQWGDRGTEPGKMNTPHTIASDNQGNIYVGDRGNQRIQVFDPDLNPIRIISNVRAPWAMCITPPNAQGQQFLYSADAGGKIYKDDLEGHPLGWFGSNGKKVGQFFWVHQMHCVSENEIFTGEAQNWRVQKVTMKPMPKSATR
jgi:hypothetical protein